MFIKIALSVLFCSIAFASADIYEGYKIYDVNTKNVFEKELVVRLSANTDYDFFALPKALEKPARVMIQPKDQNEFETILKNFGIEFVVVNENVGQTADLERMQNQLMRKAFNTSKSGISFDRYLRYNEIENYLVNLAQSHSDQVSVKIIGKSSENRNIRAITISNGDGRPDKHVILVDALHHAREWISSAVALFLINQLVENVSRNDHLLKNTEWIVIPLLNPDGYEYSHTRARMWRKTRSRVSPLCYGTDANRNYGFHWGEIGASSNPCSDIYMGPNPFSEPETQALRDEMHSISGRAKMYLSLHSYGGYMLYPPGYTTDLLPGWETLHEVGQAGAAAIEGVNGTKYIVGSSTNVLYPAAGGSDDYALLDAKIPIAITMELPSGDNGFDPKPHQINGIADESFIGIRAMAEAVISKYKMN